MNILMVEDNAGDARLLREMFNEETPRHAGLTHVVCMSDAESHLAMHSVDVILLDLGLPDVQGLEAVRRACAAAPHVPLVVLTGLDDETVALDALHEGAQDYLVKGQIDARGLLRSLRYAIERKRLKEALFLEQERAQITLDCIGDGVICTDLAGNITFLNTVAERMTRWPRREAVGLPMSSVFEMLDPMSLEPFSGCAPTRGEDSEPSLTNRILIRRDGFEIPIEDCVAPIHDRAGRPTGAVVVFRDVTVARAMSLAMLHSAEHDALTGLPNRTLLSDRIEQAIVFARRHQKQVAVLFLDLDGFKQINDSLGHPIGDKLLQSVAKRLVECGRASDTVSRRGGDEFVVVLAEVAHPEDAAIGARRILSAIAAEHSIESHALFVTASIGVAIYPGDGLDAETLVKNADTAMYWAKEHGRHGYRYFNPTIDIAAVPV
ncbi:MAG TPA: diguanylate cyclase [Gemmatimonadaceae bacterium]|nr:diguanylate cyclase [Gemmatimonadaceae bacterium]